MKRANHCVGGYTLHVYCCAPSDTESDAACNRFDEFAGETFTAAIEAAKTLGWKLRPGGVFAWCPAHASRTFEQRIQDVDERGCDTEDS